MALLPIEVRFLDKTAKIVILAGSRTDFQLLSRNQQIIVLYKVIVNFDGTIIFRLVFSFFGEQGEGGKVIHL